MKKKTTCWLVVSLVSTTFFGLAGCKTRPPTPPSKRPDPLADPVQPIVGGVDPTTTPDTTDARDSDASVNITVTPLTGTFKLDGYSGSWINPRKTVTYDDAIAICTQFGTGWELPDLKQLSRIGKINVDQQSAKKAELQELIAGRYWSGKLDGNGEACAVETISTKTECDTFQPRNSQFKVICFNATSP